MTKIGAIDWIAIVLAIIGSVNWGLVAIGGYSWDLVAMLPATLATIVYALVGIAGLYLIYTATKLGKCCGGSNPTV